MDSTSIRSSNRSSGAKFGSSSSNISSSSSSSSATSNSRSSSSSRMLGMAAGRPPGLRFMLAEVKSMRDRLSDQQRAWIRQLLLMGVHVELVHVLEAQT